MPTPEDYAAAARAMGGTGAAFGPPTPPGMGNNVQPFGPPTPEGLGVNSPAGPPPLPVVPAPQGVTPALWNGLSPEAQSTTLARMSGPAQAPPPAPEEQVGLANQFARAVTGSNSPRYSEVGGQLVRANPEAETKVPKDDEKVATSADIGQPVAGTSNGRAMVLDARGRAGGWSDSQSPIRRSTFDAERNALAGQGEAEAGLGVAQRLNNAEQSDYMAHAAEDAERRAAEAGLREQNRRDTIEGQNRELQKAISEAKNAKVTHEGFLERNPGAILMGIGAAIGGALSARTGQPNESMKSLDNTIETDLQLQRDAANRKQANVGNQQNIISLMRAKFGDERQADLAAEVAQRNIVGMHLDRLGAKAKDRETEAKIGIVKADNDAKLAELQGKWDQLTHYAAYTGAPKVDSATQGRMIQLEDGRTVLAPTTEEAAKLRLHGAAIKDLERTAKEIDKLRSDPKAYDPTGMTDSSVELKRLAAEMTLNVRRIEDIRSPGKGTSDLAKEIIGNPESLLSHTGARALAYAASERKNFDTAVRGLGGEQVQRGYRINPATGELDATAPLMGDQVNPRPAQTVARQAIK